MYESGIVPEILSCVEFTDGLELGSSSVELTIVGMELDSSYVE